jgi:hypothetical protein
MFRRELPDTIRAVHAGQKAPVFRGSVAAGKPNRETGPQLSLTEVTVKAAQCLELAGDVAELWERASS